MDQPPTHSHWSKWPAMIQYITQTSLWGLGLHFLYISSISSHMSQFSVSCLLCNRLSIAQQYEEASIAKLCLVMQTLGICPTEAEKAHWKSGSWSTLDRCCTHIHRHPFQRDVWAVSLDKWCTKVRIQSISGVKVGNSATCSDWLKLELASSNDH